MTDHPHGAGSQEPGMQQAAQGVHLYLEAHESARLVCPGCGSLFTPTRKGQRACRPSCRARASDRKLGKMPKLPWDEPAPVAKVTRRDALAALFRARPGQWIEQHELAQVAGIAGFRERRRECQVRLGMRLERQRRQLPSKAVLVFWRYQPAEAQAGAGDDGRAVIG